jgi:chromosomal replication initiator protein
MPLTNQQPYIGVQLAAPYCKRSSIIKDDRKRAEIIIKITGRYLGIHVELMKSKTRKREVVEARQIAMDFTYTYTRLSLKLIGLEFGGRDHSTVIHAKQTVADLRITDKLFSSKYMAIHSRIKQELLIN